MSETHALSLADLERDGRVWGTGRERRALCPFCGDEHPQDRAHACLTLNADTGAWTCKRCDAHGLLDEHKTKRDEDERLPRHVKRRRPAPTPPPAPREPSPADLDEDARKRARLRRLWAGTLTLDEPLAVGGLTYLGRRGIPPDAAKASRARFAHEWGSARTFVGPAVVFPVQDADGRLVAAEGRFVTPPAGVAKSHSAGTKSRGVFVAWPGALDVPELVLCEGPITALSVAACGFPCVALCGQRAPEWLPGRLALRAVLIAFDEGETKTEEKAAELVRELVAYGARPYRLRLPAGVDVNDRLQAVGVDALRAELDAAICAALEGRKGDKPRTG